MSIYTFQQFLLTKSINTDYTIKIDLDNIVEKLQDSGLYDCHLVDETDVKNTLIIWLNQLINDIENDPDWFILNYRSTIFKDNLNQD